MKKNKFYSIGAIIVCLLELGLLLYADKAPLNIAIVVGGSILVAGFFSLVPMLSALLSVLANKTWEKWCNIGRDEKMETGAFTRMICFGLIAFLALQIHLYTSGSLLPDLRKSNANTYLTTDSARVEFMLATIHTIDPSDFGKKYHLEMDYQYYDDARDTVLHQIKNSPEQLMVMYEWYEGFAPWQKENEYRDYILHKLLATNNVRYLNEYLTKAKKPNELIPYCTDIAKLNALLKARDIDTNKETKDMARKRIAELTDKQHL